MLETLRGMPDNSYDGLLCDPPYGFRFMGKKWDYDVPSVEVWREALRVLKPGAPLLAFGGARTFHRICVGIEDAGFELRDVLMWLYAKGFPKSQDVSKAIDKAAGAERPVVGTAHRKATGTAAAAWSGYGTALKPAYEPIILARKPLVGTMVENVTAWGVGGLAIDACRVGRPEGDRSSGWSKTGSAAGPNVAMSGCNTERAPAQDASARWPANLLLDEAAGAALDAEVGDRPSRPSVTRNGGGNQGGPVFDGRAGKAKPDSGYSDSGGPSRFFYCTKVSTKEREYGCEALPQRTAGEVTDREDGSDGLASPRAGAGRTGGARNHHPTLKPLSLVRWLASLIKPPGPSARLLVPYSGAGSEIIGALQAGWPYVHGIELEEDYNNIARARIAAWL